jgi:DNA-binding MarR family transcriptional regulator
MENGVKSSPMGAERACAPGSMVLLTRLAKQVYRRSSDELLGMQLRHLVALSYVRDHDACPQHELAEAFCMDANNVVLLLNELEQLGYATRLRDPDDRRRHMVQLTPAGAEALGLAERAQEAIEDDVLQALDPSERATLWQLLTRALYGAEPATEPEYSSSAVSS